MDDIDKLRLCSLNVKGLKNKLKRRSLFKYIKSKKMDIACLQEAHVIEKDVETWEKEWGGKIFYNEGTNRSQGEIILVSKHFEGHVNLILAQTRILVVSVKLSNYNFKVANVYAHNNSAEKINFFNIKFL